MSPAISTSEQLVPKRNRLLRHPRLPRWASTTSKAQKLGDSAIISVTHTQRPLCHARHDRLPLPAAGATRTLPRNVCPARHRPTVRPAVMRHGDPPRQAGRSGTASARPNRTPHPGGTSRDVDGRARTELLRCACHEIRSELTFIDAHPALHFPRFRSTFLGRVSYHAF